MSVRESLRDVAPWGIHCPLCDRRAVTTDVPCECGFRFPRGYGERRDSGPVEIEARQIRKGDDLFGHGIVRSVVWVGSSIRVNDENGPTLWPDEVVTVRRG